MPGEQRELFISPYSSSTESYKWPNRSACHKVTSLSSTSLVSVIRFPLKIKTSDAHCTVLILLHSRARARVMWIAPAHPSDCHCTAFPSCDLTAGIIWPCLYLARSADCWLSLFLLLLNFCFVSYPLSLADINCLCARRTAFILPSQCSNFPNKTPSIVFNDWSTG